jgi:hypothetical protein
MQYTALLCQLSGFHYQISYIMSRQIKYVAARSMLQFLLFPYFNLKSLGYPKSLEYFLLSDQLQCPQREYGEIFEKRCSLFICIEKQELAPVRKDLYL